ncbi:MAG: potassium channel family protein [Thermoplasmata archaeon]
MASLRRSYTVLLLTRLWKFIAVFGAVYIVAALGFYFLEPKVSLVNSFYWAIITLSTIGYGDVVPTVPLAKYFTIGVAVTQVFLLGYLITVVSATVTEASQHRVLGTLGTELSDHIVVLGYQDVGRAAVRELLAQGEKVAVVTEDSAEVANVRTLASDKQIFATYGPPGEQEILKRVNLPAAHSVIVCTKDDTTSLIAALNARSLNPSIRIVVSVSRPELKRTLQSAGVTYVASPGDMGGRLCADAAFRPEVANAVEDLTSTALGADIEEFVLSASTPISTQPLPEAERLVRSAADCIVIGYARPSATGEFVTVLNPPSSFRFQPGDAILVLGVVPNLQKLQKWIGVPQGR